MIKLRRYQLLIIDEVGYIPFDADAGNLFFQLIASRYEHASLIVTSNMPFARWGDIFGDDVIARATAEDPTARYASSLDFQDALTRALLVG